MYQYIVKKKQKNQKGTGTDIMFIKWAGFPLLFTYHIHSTEMEKMPIVPNIHRRFQFIW